MTGRKLLAAAVCLALAAGVVWWRHHATPVSIPTTGVPSASVPAARTSNVASNAPAPFNYAAALDEALREPNPHKRGMAFGDVFFQWFDEDPEAALVYLHQMPRTEEFTQSFFYAAQKLAGKDPQRALDLAKELASTKEQKYIYNALFDGFARSGITNALAYLDQLPAGDARENALRALTAAWNDADAEASLTWARSLTNETERAAAVESSLYALATKDPWRTFELAQDLLGGDAQDRILLRGLKKLLADNPQDTAKLISEMQPGPLQTRIALDAARTLADESPERAVAWLRSLPGGDLQQLALNNVLDRWSKANPAEAGQFIAQMEPGTAQAAAASHFGRDYGAANHTEAIAWAQSLSGDAARTGALVAAVDGWAHGEPADASRWATTLPPDNPARDEALRASMSYWVLADPAAAGTFAQQLSAADQPAAITAIGAALAQNDPQAALAWAQGFSTPAAQRLATETVLARWRQNDPAAAARWAQTHGF